MQAVLFIGIQGSGKSEFCKQRFYATHIRLNLDMLRTRHRETLLLDACIAAKQPFVVDNTNPAKADRARYIPKAKEAGFQIAGYYFRSTVGECMRRNEARMGKERAPRPALLGTYKKLELPSVNEGFDELFYVSIDEDGRFIVEVYRDEV